MELQNKRRWKDRLIRAGLISGIVFFGFIFPDSLSDHEKMIHFAAHVGMSFCVASFLYVLCNIRFRIPKKRSHIILIAVTLVIGAIYKYVEISGEGILHLYSLPDLLTVTGCYTSMSQNITGILAAILLIEYAAAYMKNMGSGRSAPA
ncbi:MAG: hypothetical protein P4L51_26170 [Puia sp.]|nr:hypothetical protein [Puia sp.]